MTTKLESIIDEYISSRGLFDSQMRDVVSSILIYGTPSLTKKAKEYFHERKLKIPIVIVTEEEAKKRLGNGYFPQDQKRPYLFKISSTDLYMR